MSALKKNFVSAGVPSGKVRARHIGQGAYSVFRIIILLAIGFVILYPLLYMVSTSLRSRASFMNSVRVWLPEKLDALTNYRVAIKALHYKDGLISSLKYEIVSAVLEIISCAVAAYGFARFKFPFKKMFTAMLFLTILIPDTMIIINCISASEPIASILPIIIASGLTDVSRSSITFDVFSCAIDCATI